MGSVMDDIIVVEDRVDAHCVRHVHLMSNSDPACRDIPFLLERGSVTREAGVWHYRAEYPYRGALDVACVNSEKKFRRLVVWNLDGYELIKPALYDAWQEYLRIFHGAAQYAFVRCLPAKVPNGYEVGGMTLVEAEWMMENAVAVGCKA